MPERGLSAKVSFVVFGSAVRAVSDILLAVVLVRLLPKDEYGSFRQVLLVLGSLSALVGLGLPASLYYFIPKASSRSMAGCWILGRVLMLVTGASLVGVALVLVFSQPLGMAFANPSLGLLLVAASAYPVGQVVFQTLLCYLVAVGRHKDSGLASIGLSIAQLVLVITPALLGASVQGIVLAYGLFWALCAAASLAVLYFQGVRILHPGGEITTAALLIYGLPLGMNYLVNTVNQRVDRYLIAIFHEPAIFAMFSVGATELPLVGILSYAVGSALVPEFSRLESGNRRREIVKIWHASIQKISLAIMPIALYFILFAEDFVVLVFTTDYAPAATVLRVYLLLLPLKVTTYGTVLQSLGKTREILAAAFLGLGSNLILGLWLHSLVGWTGPAWATILSQVLMIAFFLWRIAKHLSVRLVEVFPLVAWLRCLAYAAGASLFALPLLLLPIAPAVRLVLGGVLIGGAFLGIVLATGSISKSDWRLIRAWVTGTVFTNERKGQGGE